MNILMVCLGNICRSPLAEGILKHKLQSQGIKATVHSAGTSDITTHRARQFDKEDFDRYDLIYAMDQSNYDKIIRLARNEADVKKVELYLNLSSPGSNSEVPDPYWSGKDGFEHVYQLLDHAGEKLIEKIQINNKNS
ncbi:MAG: low molecular weight protein-tyrosine-phosphatase [Bacteroidales bacterium]